MGYDLLVKCSNRIGTISVQPHMSLEGIMGLIASHFDIELDSFELQVYEDESQRYIDFDAEFAEELQQITSQTPGRIFQAEVLFEVRKMESFSSLSTSYYFNYVSFDLTVFF